MTQPKAKMNIPMCAACILLCLTLFSIHLTSGLYAKYIAKGTGSDEARVAKFDVDIVGNAADGVAVDWKVTSDVYTINVKNNSEVAVEYQITVTDLSEKGVVSVLDSNSGQLAANGSAKDHTLTFTVNDWTKVNTLLADKNGEKAQISLDFTVTIDVVQID